VLLKVKHTRTERSNLGPKYIVGKPAVALKFMHHIPPLGALNTNYPCRTGISTCSQLGSVRTPADAIPVLAILFPRRRPLLVCPNMERSACGFLLQAAACKTITTEQWSCLGKGEACSVKEFRASGR